MTETPKINKAYNQKSKNQLLLGVGFYLSAILALIVSASLNFYFLFLFIPLVILGFITNLIGLITCAKNYEEDSALMMNNEAILLGNLYLVVMAGFFLIFLFVKISNFNIGT